MRPPFKTHYLVFCEHCSSPDQTLDDASVDRYLAGIHPYCPQCGWRSSLYRSTLQTLRSGMGNMFSPLAATLIGAETVAFQVTLKRHQTVELNLADYGVPEDSHILKVNYSSIGPLQALEWHGNEPIWQPLMVRHLYGIDIPIPGTVLTAPALVNVLVSYIPPQPGQAAVYSLSKAYSHFLAGQWGQMAIAAITGIEFTLKRAMSAYAPAGRRLKDKDYLTNIYPGYCQQHRLPVPASEIIDCVSRLWGTRDKYAHEGLLFPGYDRDSALRQLCAALFLYRHIKKYGP